MAATIPTAKTSDDAFQSLAEVFVTLWDNHTTIISLWLFLLVFYVAAYLIVRSKHLSIRSYLNTRGDAPLLSCINAMRQSLSTSFAGFTIGLIVAVVGLELVPDDGALFQVIALIPVFVVMFLQVAQAVVAILGLDY